MNQDKYFNRELSWLSFNYRVLQEAADQSNPLFERIKFLAIYSSNLDEFFRVRVASLRSLLRLKKESRDQLCFDPEELLKSIHKTVFKQQEEFGRIFREEIRTELANNNIFLVNDSELNDEQKDFVKDYFQQNVVFRIQPILLVKNKIKPFLKNRHLYFAVRLAHKFNVDKPTGRKRHSYAVVEIPAGELPRFVQLPSSDNNHYVIFLDDIIRFCLNDVFNAFDIVDAFSIKLNRDAELYIDDEFAGNLLKKIQKGLNKRDTGVPSRFLYDQQMPGKFLKFLRESLDLSKEDLVPGGRYHNFNNFFSFPNPLGNKLENKPLPPLQIKQFDNCTSMFDVIHQDDIGVHYPYQSYDSVIKFLSDAASDPAVKSIKVTQYRVANNSKVVQALINAAGQGKDVTAFVELKARFDEEANIQWAKEMENAGVKVYYSFPGLKVHAKLAMIDREDNGELKKYCYLSTGNFNEITAKIYADFGLFTADERITSEVSKVFEFLSGGEIEGKFKHLLVAQFNMRKKFLKMIEKEIENSINGAESGIVLKMNSLEDRKMINKLYEASQAGVKINIIVRGICCLRPGVKGLSENITVISIVDRFLEHSRFYLFHNGGRKRLYAASADWMKRNLSRRIETAFPIFDERIKQEIIDIINLQLNDNVKARVIDNKDSNAFVNTNKDITVRSQIDTHKYLSL